MRVSKEEMELRKWCIDATVALGTSLCDAEQIYEFITGETIGSYTLGNTPICCTSSDYKDCKSIPVESEEELSYLFE